MTHDNLPKSANEYMQCFRQLAAITHAALVHMEMNRADFVSESDFNRSLARIAEAVETVSSLRGDSGVFVDSSRPAGLADFQSEMYATEDELRDHLIRLGYVYPKYN